MFVQKRIAAVSLVALVAAVGAVAYVLTHRVAAAPMAADKPAGERERAEQEWRDLGGRHVEEMVRARLEVAEQEEQLRLREQALSAVRTDLTNRRQLIDSFLKKMAQPKVPHQLLEEEKDLGAQEQKIRADVVKARQKFFAAEEKMWQLAREQALQRDRIRVRLGAAAEKRGSEQGTLLQRRLQKAERELDQLRRQLAELRRPAQQPPAP